MLIGRSVTSLPPVLSVDPQRARGDEERAEPDADRGDRAPRRDRADDERDADDRHRRRHERGGRPVEASWFGHPRDKGTDHGSAVAARSAGPRTRPRAGAPAASGASPSGNRAAGGGVSAAAATTMAKASRRMASATPPEGSGSPNTIGPAAIVV